MEKNRRETFELSDKALLCFSHLRWDFVYQRPQHLMTRMAKQARVYFIEEALYHDHADTLEMNEVQPNVCVVKPYLKHSVSQFSFKKRMAAVLDKLIATENILSFDCWYYTPMALKFSGHLSPEIVIYDCMDELSAFSFAPPELKLFEKKLFANADVVFTGGHSLYEAKKDSHHNIYPFPSSIEKDHFAQARYQTHIPADQKNITGKLFGFYGVVDERFDIELIKEVADRRPHWQFVIVGPVVKIDEKTLPRKHNIHYLGGKSYKELPAYLSGWDIAMIPFAKNESTQFISPTKTPEYLAGGKPVISKSIQDVVQPYGEQGLVYIADTADEFIAAAETEFAKTTLEQQLWLKEVDDFLKDISWDKTANDMLALMSAAVNKKKINEVMVTSNTVGV